ncbi:Tyrosine recombinase XerC [subsurface metagenome]
MMNDYLERFINCLDIEWGYSQNTMKTYGLILKGFFTFIEAGKIKLKKLKKEHIKVYIRYLREEQKNCSKTIRLKIAVLRCFLQFLTDKTKLYSKNPIAPSDFKYKVEQKYAESISEGKMDALLATVEKEIQKAKDALGATSGKTTLWEKRVFAAKRDHLILKLLLSTGLRISEALEIRIKDIDFVDKSIRIFGKGKKYRQVFYDLDEVEDEFLQYIEDWKKLNIEHDYLFVSIKSYNRMTPRGFQLLLKKYLRQAALSLSISPHILRHTFATLSIEKGANIKAVSQILGHANCDITIDLYTHLSNNHLRAVMQKCNPLSREVIPIEERIEMRKEHLAYLEKTG